MEHDYDDFEYANGDACPKAEEIWGELSVNGERFLVDHVKPVLGYSRAVSKYNNAHENWTTLKFDTFKVHYVVDHTTSVIIELFHVDGREDDELFLYNDDIKDANGWSWYSDIDLERLLLA